MLKKVGIHNKLSLVLLGFAILMLAGLGLPIYLYGRTAFIEAAYSKLQIASLEKYSSLHIWLHDAENQLITIASQTELVEVVITAQDSSRPDQVHQQTRRYLLGQFKQWTGPDQKFGTLMLLAPNDGKIIVSTDPYQAGQHLQDRTYFNRAQTGLSSTTIANPDLPGRADLYLAVPMYAPHGELVGVLAARIRQTEIQSLIQKPGGYGSSLNSYLIDGSSQTLSLPNQLSGSQFAEAGLPAEAVAACLAASSGSYRPANLSRMTALIAYEWIPEINSCLLVEVGVEEALASFRDFSLLMLVVSGLVVLATIGLAIWLGRTLARPMMQLVKDVETHDPDRPGVPLPVTSEDELGRLAAAINATNLHLDASRKETSYSQRVLVSLSQAAQALLRSTTQEEVFTRIGQAFNQLDYHATIMLVDDSGKFLTIPYTTIHPKSLDFAERLTGLTFQSYRLKLTPESRFTQILTHEHTALFDPAMSAIAEALPQAFVPLAERIAASLGIQQSLINRIEVAGAPYGLLVVTGKGLTESDINAVTIFAKQASFALDNIRLIENLRASEELFRSLIENASDIISVCDPQLNFTYQSPSIERMLGYPAETLVGRLPSDLIHPDNHQTIEEAVSRLLQNPGESQQFEFSCRHANGEWRVLDTFGKTIETGNGETMIVLNSRDVTEQRAGADALRQARDELEQRVQERTSALEESQRALETLMANLPGMAYRSCNDLSWTMEFASQGCLELTGYAPEELMENKINYNNLIHPDDRSEVRKSIQIAVSQRETYTLGYRLLDAAGVEKWIWEKGQGIYDRKGKLVALEGFISDISNLERAQQALQQSEERLRRAVLDAPFPIMIHAEGGEILETSHTWEELSGYSREDVPTMIDWLRAAHGEAAEAALAEVNRIYERTDRKHNGEYTILSRQGETLTWDFSSAPLGRLADGRRLGISMAMDVTHRKHSEEQLRHIAEELVRSNAELEQFAYVASHDLQEPLRMVASYLQLLERRYGQLFDQDGHEFIQFAVEGATRMKALINDLLAYSRVGTHGREMEPVDLDGALSQALTNLTLVIEDKQAVVQADPLPTVLGDEVQLIQLFQNLIGNAIKFHSEAPPQVQVCVEREENQWRFSIHDNGIGFDPQYASRIFVIFKRLNQQEAYPGTGIGLAISKRIVERHFGKIWCESVPGQGSTFFFSLPVLNESIPL